MTHSENGTGNGSEISGLFVIHAEGVFLWG
jgi:hypothetical protein